MSKIRGHGENFNDDIQVGRVLLRREVLLMLGGAGMSHLAGCSGGNSTDISPISAPTPRGTGPPIPVNSCKVKPELTIGPYFVDERLNRSDIRADPKLDVVKQGVQLNFTFQVSRMTSGASLSF